VPQPKSCPLCARATLRSPPVFRHFPSFSGTFHRRLGAEITEFHRTSQPISRRLELYCASIHCKSFRMLSLLRDFARRQVSARRPSTASLALLAESTPLFGHFARNDPIFQAIRRLDPRRARCTHLAPCTLGPLWPSGVKNIREWLDSQFPHHGTAGLAPPAPTWRVRWVLETTRSRSIWADRRSRHFHAPNRLKLHHRTPLMQLSPIPR